MAKRLQYESVLHCLNEATAYFEFEADSVDLARDHAQTLANSGVFGYDWNGEPDYLKMVKFRQIGATNWRTVHTTCHPNDQPQDTTLVPIEEDSELNVTPGEWQIWGNAIAANNGDDTICDVLGLKGDKYLIVQAKNMYAMLKKLIADHDETSTSYLSENRKNIELAKQLLNNCKHKP